MRFIRMVLASPFFVVAAASMLVGIVLAGPRTAEWLSDEMQRFNARNDA